MHQDVIFKYFPDLTAKQQEQIIQLMPLYLEWNAQINVISRKDVEELYVRHVLHSLAIAKVQAFLPGAQVLDIGTGGGFPGIPLAILFPETSFLLVDSIGKKIKVVNEVAKALGLSNVQGVHARAEDIDSQFDFVVSRAVTRMKPFYGWTKGKIKKESNHELPNGILYLKGGDLTEELLESKLRYKIYELPSYFAEDFFDTKKVVYVPRQ
ncbi:16S rRNA (guanine(527)-N(7))-methyltransferase RsmG [Reichenbachiella carrageenanivorans]|uniref:16S rRNA (guanine(527)-N(7))-methyltransferase RsmG n=1 Tax=Reichenbachiella carrageenanivorans TaxID=2979869 RepID=UPI00389A5A45